MRLTVAVAVACLIGGVSIADDARASIKRQTNIPEQNLGEALQSLAKDRNVQVVYFSTAIDSLKTPGAAGDLTTDEAFEKVLSGTGFTYRYLGDKTITIVPIADSASSAGSGARKGKSVPGTTSRSSTDTSDGTPRANHSASFWSRFRLAQAETAPASGAERKPDEQSAQGDSQASSRHLAPVEQVTVTGTHIRGAENLTAPLIVLDREFIEATGATTAIQLVESLPQNFALVNQSVSGGTLSGNSFSTLQGSTINLRGMGEGTTLTLVNGRRMPLGYDGSAVNITAIPLSAIERVEVLTDGASALYGSDAVGGVVNFVLRKEFDGAETRARYGSADDVNEHRLSQTFGHNWSSGNFVASAEHFQRDALEASDRKFGVGGTATTIGWLLPKDENLALSLFGRQDLTPNLELFADVLYMDRESENRSGHLTLTTARTNYIDNTQLSATAGVGLRLGPSWRVELSGGYGEDDMELRIVDPPSTAVRTGYIPVLAKFTGADLKADGALFDLPGGALRLAVGAHWREESHSYRQISHSAAGALVNNFAFDMDRKVGSLFVESLVPLVGSDNAKPWLRRLELSLAGRYDDYSDFGSSVDPRIGIAWMPADSLKLRGSWGTSYLAPKLKDFDLSFNSAAAVDNYPLANGLHVLAVGGNAPENLKAQESKNYTLGFDFRPVFLPGATFSVNYYNIAYRQKIETLAISFTTLLSNPAAYGDLFILDPTVAQVQQYIALGTAGGRPFQAINPNGTPNPNFDPADVELIVDSRRRNIGVVKSKGFDVSAAYDCAGLGGDVRIGLDGSWIDDILKQVTATSAAVGMIDTFANPTQWRLRGQFGYRNGGWALNSFIHYRNSYTDNRFLPFVEMDSYTTVDANVAYRFGEGTSVLSNMSITLGATNLFDEDPPGARVRPTTGQYDLGFDSANASPLGRLVTLDVTKTW